MSLGPLLGNERICRQLRQPGRLPNTILIAGPQGSGKRTLATLLAQAMVCQQPEKAPCLTCRACQNAARGIHPDVISAEHFMSGEDVARDRDIKVDPMRQLREDAYIRPNQARRKVYLISRAHRMNDSAQNALLKLLEEGPPYAAFLLLTDQPMGLLQTIRSRCFRYDMAPLTPEEALPALRDRFPQAAEPALTQALRSAGGYLGPALALLEEGEAPREEDKSLSDLIALLRDPSELGLMEWSVAYQLEKPPKEKLAAFYEGWNELVLRELTATPRQTALSPAQLLCAQTLARKGRQALDFNVAPAHSIGWFAASLWEILEG